MNCNVCGETRTTGDCRCTWYGYGSAEAFGEAVAIRARRAVLQTGSYKGVIKPTPPLSGRAPLELDGEV